MKKFKDYISEAQITNQPDLHPPGTHLIINDKRGFGKYKPGDKFEIMDIGKIAPEKIDFDLGSKRRQKRTVFVVLKDSRGKLISAALNGETANEVFRKWDKSNPTLFTNKSLTPDEMGLGGMTVNKGGMMNTLKTFFDRNTSKYPEPIPSDLLSYAERSYTNKSIIDISDTKSNFSKKDYGIISKNYGEVMCAMWALKSMKASVVEFPNSFNEPLIDFYAIVKGIKIPVSVKSRGGQPAALSNILKTLKDNGTQLKDTFTEKEKVAVNVMQSIVNKSMKDGAIEGNRILNTKAINELSKVMGLSVDSITNEAIDIWLSNIDVKDMKAILAPFHRAASSNMLQRSWDALESGNRKKNRFVIAPLSSILARTMSKSKDMMSALNKMGKTITVVNMDIDVNTRKATFDMKEFKDLKLGFMDGSYAAGGKIKFNIIK